MLYAMKELAFEFQSYLVFITYVTFNILLNAPWIFFSFRLYNLFTPQDYCDNFVCVHVYIFMINSQGQTARVRVTASSWKQIFICLKHLHSIWHPAISQRQKVGLRGNVLLLVLDPCVWVYICACVHISLCQYNLDAFTSKFLVKNTKNQVKFC